MLWVLLISWAALRTGGLPEAPNYPGLVIGVAGILTTILTLSDLGAVFGLGQIGRFIWLDMVMVRNSPDIPVQ